MTPTLTPVLIIDDDTDHCFLLEHLLMLEDIPAVAVHSLEAALYHLQHYPTRQVILDNQLPDGRGSDFLKTIFQIDPSVQVIFATADTTRGLKQRMISQGASAFFSKPYDHRLLVKSLQQDTRQLC